MGRDRPTKFDKKEEPRKVKKALHKEHPQLKKGRKAEAEAAKLERRKVRKEQEKKVERRQEAIEEEEVKIETELFDPQGYYAGPVGEVSRMMRERNRAKESPRATECCWRNSARREATWPT